MKRLVDLSRFTLELNSLEVKSFLLTKETYYTSCIELDLGKKDTDLLSSRFPEKIFMISSCSIEGKFQYVEGNKISFFCPQLGLYKKNIPRQGGLTRSRLRWHILPFCFFCFFVSL